MSGGWHGWSLERMGTSLPLPMKPSIRRVRDIAMGRWPRPVADWRLSRVGQDPVTYTEKVHWRMAYDRRPILTTFADKVAMRDYVVDRIGPQFLTEVYGIHERASEIGWSALPREYVCKASHGSGTVVLVWDGAPADLQLPASATHAGWDRFQVRPGPDVESRLSQLVTMWMSLNFEYGPGRLPEWAYREVPPRVIFEELLRDADGNVPSDYKFYTFDGTVEVVQVDTARFGRHRREYFRADGAPIAVDQESGARDAPVVLPESWPEMLEVAQELGRDMDHVRVDLYDLPGRIVLGEITSTPGGAVGEFKPKSFEYEFGAYWTLPSLPALPALSS